MGRIKKNKKLAARGGRRKKITPASLVGISLGLVIVGSGLYSAVYMKEYGGLYVVLLGAVLLVAVVWGSLRKR